MKVLKVSRLVTASSVVVALVFGTQCFAEGNGTDTVKSKKQVSGSAKQLKPQTTCPVYGGDIDKSQFVDVNGKRIYVCCAACITDIKKDPEKYIKKLETLGQGVEAIPQSTKSVPAPVKTDPIDHSKMKH